MRGKIGSTRISQVAIPQGPNIISGSTNYDPGESGLAASLRRQSLTAALGASRAETKLQEGWVWKPGESRRKEIVESFRHVGMSASCLSECLEL